MSSRKNKKEVEDQKKKDEEQAAAQAYEEFVATFEQAPMQKGKVWVKAGTFDAGSRKEDSKDKGKLYKPTSKLAELAEKFSTPEKAAAAAVPRDGRPDKPGKKTKEKEKKKSNLELFKEELKVLQEERAERHRVKQNYTRESGKQSRFEAPESKQQSSYTAEDSKQGSFDPGDPTTTNLYLGNLSPKITEQRLMEVFGRYGPLASIKIMWPRTDDERVRGRNCGFVAFMNRTDGERALQRIGGKDVDGFEMKLGWGKAVPIPPHPIYIPPALMEMFLPPPPSGLPFNAQPAKRDKDMVPPMGPPLPADTEAREMMDKILSRAVVKVVIPTERSLLQLIHRMIEFVIQEGPMFEAMIMNKEINNSDFRFLFDNQSPAHVYYRWKMFSMLQGDSQNKWSVRPFRMFKSGSVWKPPPLNPFLQGMPEELVREEEEEVKDNIKGSLSVTQRKRLESMLRRLTPERDSIGELMVWCIEHADAAEEICECLKESLTNHPTRIQKKIARLYLVSDILNNCAAKVSNASHFRKGFQTRLMEIFVGLHEAYSGIESRLKAEQMKQRVMHVFRAWEDWTIYPHDFLIQLQNIFLGLITKADKEEKSGNGRQEGDVDGIPLDDVDGVPIEKRHDVIEDIDGVPLGVSGATKNVASPVIKSAAMGALLGYADDDDDIDGMPLEEDVMDGLPLEEETNGDGSVLGSALLGKGFTATKWETVDPDEVKSQAVTTSKWERFEAGADDSGEDVSGSDRTPVYDTPPYGTPPPQKQQDQKGSPQVSLANDDSDDLDGKPLVYEDYKPRRQSSDDESRSQDGADVRDSQDGHSEQSEDSRNFDIRDGSTAGMSEERRQRLRESEVKVMQYQDELERGVRQLKSGYSVARQVQHYRHKLLRKIERESSERKRHRSRHRSASPDPRTPPSSHRGTKRSRSPHRSQARRGKSRSPTSRRHRSRSPRRHRSKSPKGGRSPPRKHKKKRH